MKRYFPNQCADKAPLKRSHWMREAGMLAPSEPPLSADLNNIDVAIIGGGFVGLWTAIFAKQTAPEKRIVILERDMCGGGASGRNGGLVMSWWSDIFSLVELFGEENARQLANRSQQAISELEAFCQTHNIDAHFKRGGWIWSATNEAQRTVWESTIALAEQVGDSPYQRLSAEAAAKRTGSDKHLAGIIDPHNATIQPAKLLAGMKRVAKDLGIDIYEQTPVSEIRYRGDSELITPNARVYAQKVVIATNAWASAFAELRPYITPVSSTITVSEPIPDTLNAIGWQRGDGISDTNQMIAYYSTTHDGRVVYGKSFARLSLTGKIGAMFSHNAQDGLATQNAFRRVYPTLNSLAFVDAWNGPVDYNYEHFPVFGHLKDAPNIVYGVGWSGNGISPSQIGGRVLAALALELDNEWSNSVLVGTIDRGLNRKFPPKPIRYFGGQVIRQAIIVCERCDAQHKKPPRILRWLANLAGDIGT